MSVKTRRDEKAVFEFPEFDREEYIEKEFRDARTSRYIIGLAFLLAMVSYALVRVVGTSPIIGLILTLMAMGVLKEFFAFVKVDTSAFERKNWAGNVLLLFFGWFGILTLLLNPPFHDMVNPHIRSIDIYTVSGSNETAGSLNYSLETAENLPLHTRITINASVMDNNRVENVTLTITFPETANRTAEKRHMEPTGNKDEYTAGSLVLDIQGTYSFTIRATDDHGNTNQRTRTLTAQAPSR